MNEYDMCISVCKCDMCTRVCDVYEGVCDVCEGVWECGVYVTFVRAKKNLWYGEGIGMKKKKSPSQNSHTHARITHSLT